MGKRKGLFLNIVYRYKIQKRGRKFKKNHKKSRKVESRPPTLILDMAPEKTKKAAKMCGYLEKRGKLTITGKWKKWWCVLEGQLLLYYKSRTQYLNLSPCCGSLNVALVKSVQPHVGRQIHMLTHSQLVILRASSKEKQQNWFLAFVNILQKNKYEAFIPKETDRTPKYQVYEPCDYCKNNPNEYNDPNISTHRENKFDLDFRIKNREIEPDENLRLNDTRPLQSNGINSSRNKKFTTADGKRSSSHDHLEVVTADVTQRPEPDIRIKRFYSVECVTNLTKDFSLSTDKSFSHHSIVHYKYRKPSRLIDEYEFQFERNIARPSSKGKLVYDTHETKRKESFNFLKKVFSSHAKRRDLGDKLDSEEMQEVNVKDEQTTAVETLHNHLGNHSEEVAEVNETRFAVERKTEETDQVRDNREFSGICPTERPEFRRNSKRFSTCLPSRITNNTQCVESPVLPVKQRINSAIYSSKIAELNSGAYDSIGKSFESEMRHAVTNLDSLLQQLSMITQDEIKSESSEHGDNEDSEEDPDYDVPIPHASLIDNKIASRTETDSLHNLRSENTSYFSMTPDSLEASWINRWSTPDYRFDIANNQSGSDDNVFLDSLTPHLRL